MHHVLDVIFRFGVFAGAVGTLPTPSWRSSFLVCFAAAAAQ
jgi:hypothetical protein